MSDQKRKLAVQALRDTVAAAWSAGHVSSGWAARQTNIGIELACLLVMGQLEHRRARR